MGWHTSKPPSSSLPRIELKGAPVRSAEALELLASSPTPLPSPGRAPNYTSSVGGDRAASAPILSSQGKKQTSETQSHSLSALPTECTRFITAWHRRSSRSTSRVASLICSRKSESL